MTPSNTYAPRIQTLIEAQEINELDLEGIRGGWEWDLAYVGQCSFVGYDYVNQCWIEHEWKGVTV